MSRLAHDSLATVLVLAIVGVVFSEFSEPPVRGTADASGLRSVSLSLEGATIDGQRTAPAVVMVFADFECAYCGHVARTVMPIVRDKLVATGESFVAFRHLPLDLIHPHAATAAAAALCAGEQGHFWRMHDELFGDQARLEVGDLSASAARIGADAAEFGACLLADRVKAQVRRDIDLATELGIASTPTILVGVAIEDDRMLVVNRFGGNVTAQAIIDAVRSVESPRTRQGS